MADAATVLAAITQYLQEDPDNYIYFDNAGALAAAIADFIAGRRSASPFRQHRA